MTVHFQNSRRLWLASLAAVAGSSPLTAEPTEPVTPNARTGGGKGGGGGKGKDKGKKGADKTKPPRKNASE